jgi:predicted secreted protein
MMISNHYMITLEQQNLAWKEATTRKREHWKAKLVVLKEKRVVENEKMFIKEQMSNEVVLKKFFDEAWSTKVLYWTKQCTTHYD